MERQFPAAPSFGIFRRASGHASLCRGAAWPVIPPTTFSVPPINMDSYSSNDIQCATHQQQPGQKKKKKKKKKKNTACNPCFFNT
eukprot:NODE_7104_length_461_cov_143.948276.p2 GENE.NODE_7104_length_461_cov_143.948276~~NODE_7104_length_461_cov_143.948276.p2  ORF type:complete len:85 (-),score=38.24 NODE_7104_length_461_cov_143.948276:22-276(-)